MFFSGDEFVENIEKKLHNSSDLGNRVLKICDKEVAIVFLKSMTDGELLSSGIIRPISKITHNISFEEIEKIITTNEVVKIEENEICAKILDGCVVLFLENEKDYICIDIQKFALRPPSEPPTSPVIKGPRQGFTEDIKTNISLLRRRFFSENFEIQQMKIGKYTQTKICIAFLNGVADEKVIRQIERRLKKIDIDGIVDSYYVLEFLQNRPNSFFRQVGQSEKPDVVASKILEGRVAVMVDGSPIVLTLPYVFVESLQSSNDYYTNSYFSTFIRYVRVIALLLAVVVPGAYLALRLFHYNVIPTEFLITIADTTQVIPFTPFIELLFITLLFQILYEVSLRLPSYLGLATSIVGALILGDTGVNAGLISPPGVIVVALSKIAAYTFPDESSEITVLQLIFLILGGSLGFLGIIGGMIYFVNYLNQIDSYGAPYLAPFSPRVSSDLKDALTKTPLTNMQKRPQSFVNKNKRRQNERKNIR